MQKKIAVTIFENLEASKGELTEIPFSRFKKALTQRMGVTNKKSLPLFVCSEFGSEVTDRGSVRFDGNVRSVSAVVLDYDEGKCSMVDAAKGLTEAGLLSVVVPTASWTPDKPRWRAVVALDDPVVGSPGELKVIRRKMVEEVTRVLRESCGADFAFSSETNTLSQSYFYGLPDIAEYPPGVDVPGTPLRTQKFKSNVVHLGSTDDRGRGLGGGDMVTPSDREIGAGRADPGRGNGVQDRTTDGYSSHVSDEDFAKYCEVLRTGEGEVHAAMLPVSMALVNRGMPGAIVVDYMQRLFRDWEEPTSRWKERYTSINRVVDGAVRRKNRDAWGRADIPEDPEGNGIHIPDVDYVQKVLSGAVVIPNPPLLIEGYIPMNKAGGFVAPGGTGKSTLLLYEAVHVILGRDLYGMKINSPGNVVYFSAEDDTDLVLFRLFKIVAEMGLTDEERNRVGAGFCVIPVMGATGGFRLVVDRMGTCSPTPWVHWSIQQVKSRQAVMTIFDPTSLVGPGERAMNDGMAELMKTGNFIGNKSCSAVRFVHHETKSTEKRYDQYSGRGGAAFADNSRSIVQLVSLRGRKQEEFAVNGISYLVPEELGAKDEDYEKGRVLGILRHKLTAMELDTTPIFLLRSGFSYKWGFGVPEVSEEGVALKEQRDREVENQKRERADTEMLPAVLEFLTQAPAGKNAKAIMERLRGSGVTVKDAALREELERWSEDGKLLKVPGQRAGSFVFRVVL